MTQILNNRYVKRPSGIAVSANETILYLVENHSAANRLLAFQLQKDGSVADTPPRIIHDFGRGRGGDGLCLDRQGQ